jgi:hypothetical protein
MKIHIYSQHLSPVKKFFVSNCNKYKFKNDVKPENRSEDSRKKNGRYGGGHHSAPAGPPGHRSIQSAPTSLENFSFLRPTVN